MGRTALSPWRRFSSMGRTALYPRRRDSDLGRRNCSLGRGISSMGRRLCTRTRPGGSRTEKAEIQALQGRTIACVPEEAGFEAGPRGCGGTG